MRRSTLTLAAVTLLVLSTGLLAQTRVPGPPSGATARAAQPQRDARQQSGTAILRGRILAAATGTPVRRAQVRAVAAGTRISRLVTSDDAGWFEIRDLPAGRWELTASKAGFVTMRFGQRRAFESGRPLEVANGAVIERVDFHLPRGAAITGRVFDEFGDPVAGARVQPLRYRWVQGERRLSPAGMTTQTDDTGAFRIFGLMPGEYFVSAVLRALPVDDGADSTAYAPTYYPGTGTAAQAQPVTLGIGEEIAIAFGLLAVRTARISGTVVSAAGEPLVNGTVRLQAADGGPAGPVAFGGGTRTRADGTFTLANVAPGSYRLVAVSDNTRRPGGVEYEMGSTSVSVAGDDVAGVTVATARGAMLSGTVAVASGSGALPPGNLQVTAPAVGPSVAVVGARPAPVARDGSFRLSGLFGARLVRLNGLPQGWMLESVTVGGRDVTDEGVLFDSSQQMVDARILVTNRITELTGTVTDAAGRMATDVAVVVFPEDENRWTPPSRHLRSARPDQQGVFRVGALPPDRYFAVAVDYLEEGEDTDPEFLRWARHAATSFRLPSGGTVAVSLKAVER